MSPALLNITVPVPCIQGAFGQRLVTYTSQVQPSQIRQILGHDPRPKNWKNLEEKTREIYQQIQRPTSKDRRNAVSEYLVQRLGSTRPHIAAFPAISIGLSHPTEFKALVGIGDDAIGTLHISDRGQRIVLDGLGRISGCLDLLEDKDVNGEGIVNSIALPVTFYVPAPGTEPLSVGELGQLFSDFNFRVHLVRPQVNMALDQSDIYIKLANDLARRSFIADFGGMETKAASLGKNSTALVVQTVLVRTVRGATEGRDFQESNLAHPKNPNLTDDKFLPELDAIAAFFTAIQERMGDRWKLRDNLHLSSPGLQALGVIFHDMNHRTLKLSTAEREYMYTAIASIDWSRTNRAWVDDAMLGAWGKPKGSDAEQLVITGAGRSNTQAIIDYVRVKTGLQAKLDALKPENKSDAVAPEVAA